MLGHHTYRPTDGYRSYSWLKSAILFLPVGNRGVTEFLKPLTLSLSLLSFNSQKTFSPSRFYSFSFIYTYRYQDINYNLVHQWTTAQLEDSKVDQCRSRKHKNDLYNLKYNIQITKKQIQFVRMRCRDLDEYENGRMEKNGERRRTKTVSCF